MLFQQTWAGYLCCRPMDPIGNHPDLLNDIGKVIVHLLGDESLHPYRGKYIIANLGNVFEVNIVKSYLDGWLVVLRILRRFSGISAISRLGSRR